eukprot:3914964-Alexandrium_andersonii.AAC.1
MSASLVGSEMCIRDRFDTSLPVLDRVRILEAGDGRFSQFSGDGKEIRERFEAGMIHSARALSAATT